MNIRCQVVVTNAANAAAVVVPAMMTVLDVFSDVHYWKDDGTGAAAGALASEIDQHPYVSITISTGD